MRPKRWDGMVGPARRAVSAARRLMVGVAGAVFVSVGAQAQTPVPMPAPTVKYPAGENGRVTGPIVMKRGTDLLIRDETTKETSVVTLQPATRITRPSGFLNLDRKAYSPSILMPGLLIDVRGTGDSRGTLAADRISFHESALQTAIQIAAADEELRAEERRLAATVRANHESLIAAIDRVRDSLAALKKRLAERPRPAFAIKASATVHFAPGSVELTTEARRTLDVLIAQNRGTEDFRIDVAGFTDTTGPADLNEMLSTTRARAVVDYLTRVHAIAPQRFANPVGEEASHPVAPNDTPAGRAQNRRVEVQVLVHRGVREGQP